MERCKNRFFMRYILIIMAVMLCTVGCGRADSETAGVEGDVIPEAETQETAKEDGGGTPEITEDAQTLEKETAEGTEAANETLETQAMQTLTTEEAGSGNEGDGAGNGAGGEGEGLFSKAVLGDEQFDEYMPLLEGRRVALFSNHTGIVGDRTDGTWDEGAQSGEDPTLIPFGKDSAGEDITYGQHILDALIERGADVTAIFSPEHGFRGNEDAGESVSDSVDEKTGVPILSLYSNDTVYPSEEDMSCFDVLVVDMQDVGLRYYTYYIGLYHLMDACASHDKEVIILDRPNPNGFYVDGPILKEGYESGVGELPIPVVYGMTWGELAGMINGEGWLKAGKDALKLTVIPCRNYTHRSKTAIIRNPSPNIKDMRAVYLYASTCFFEQTVCSVGRGTDHPFEIYGSPALKDMEGFDFSFTPKSMEGATEPPFKGEACYGRDLRGIPVSDIWEAGVDPGYILEAYEAYKKAMPEGDFFGKPDKKGRYWLDYLSGSDELRKQIMAGKSAQEIKASWQEDIEAFREQRAPYLLYEE